MVTFNLNVNGEIHKIEEESDTPLIFVLRNNLSLKSPKLGCGQEQCGACVVLVNGEAENSCVRAASEFEGDEIITVEGLSRNGKLSPVQEVFQHEGAAQCGYCTSGIIVAATALFQKNPKPSDKDIKESLYDHLCRCGSHSRVLKAIRFIRDGLN